MRILNGLIVDGTGRAAFRGNLEICGDKITAVEEAPAQVFTPGPEDVDAAGCVVSPGFIDFHAHSDAYLVIEPDAPSKLAQGITTEVNGQCGGSAAPRYGRARLSGDWAAILGEKLSWRSMAEYREVLAQAKIGINTVQFVGHNTLRSSVLGYEPLGATKEALAEMERLLARELDDGAWGLSTGLIYQPGKYSDFAEVAALAKTAAARGGLYSTHMRSEGDEILPAIDEVLSLVRASGIRAEISHLKTSGRNNWHKIDAVIEKLDAAVGAGELLGSDRYPFCASATDLDIVLPDWAQVGAASKECERLADSATTKRIIDEINASSRDWHTVMIGGTWQRETKACSGRTVAELALERHLTPGEIITHVLRLDRCLTGAFFFGMSESNLRRILAQNWMVAGSDASLRAPWGALANDYPHPRAYGTMPQFFRLLTGREAFGDGARLDFTLEEAVRRMTGIPAARLGLVNRGVLRRGAFADVAVWRADEFKSASTYDKVHQFARGMEYVFVNGRLACRRGEFMRAGAGRFLERR